jgi:hypothetical protein
LPSTFPLPLQMSHSTMSLPEGIFPLPLHSSQFTGIEPLPLHFAQSTSPSPLQALQIKNLISTRQNGEFWVSAQNISRLDLSDCFSGSVKSSNRT